MRSLNEILLPTDFSPRSADVVHFAGEVARHFRSKVTLLHVLPPINPTWAVLEKATLLEEVMEHQREETRVRLDRFMAEEFQDVDVRRLVLEGDPATIIAEYASQVRVDLLMMATRGCSAFRRFLLGSVTAKVLHDVACPVWTSSHIVDGRQKMPPIPNVIVCAAGVTPEGEAILRWASDLAADFESRLVVVNAIPSLEYHPETYYLEADMRRALIKDARARLSRILASSRTPEAEIRVEGGHVSTVVRSVVEDYKADLLIIGRASAKGMMGRLRTHSYALIRESPCPVISV